MDNKRKSVKQKNTSISKQGTNQNYRYRNSKNTTRTSRNPSNHLNSSSIAHKKSKTVRSSNKEKNNQFTIMVTSWILRVSLCILFYFGATVIVKDLSASAYNFSYQIFGNVSMDKANGKEIKFKVSEKDSLKDIAKKLEKKKIIENSQSFYIRGTLSTNEDRKIIPGTYKLSSTNNYDEILDILTNNDTIG